MTIQRRPRPQRRRKITALILAAAIPWLAAVTAASDTGQAAIKAIGQQGSLALGIFRSQLGDTVSGTPKKHRYSFTDFRKLPTIRKRMPTMRHTQAATLT